nr:hp [Calliteara abietis nucleopolyhedrovirus]
MTMTMNVLKHQLFEAQTLPYITKKCINDALCDYVLNNLPNAFFVDVYQTAVLLMQQRTDNTARCVLKGGAAIATLLSNTKCKLHDTKLRVHFNNETVTVNEIDVNNVFDLLPINELQVVLTRATRKYRATISEILTTITWAQLLSLCTTTTTAASSDVHHQSIVVFQSYVDRAIVFPPSHCINFALDDSIRPDIKLTVSMVNGNEHVLIRYSFNVTVQSSWPIWLYGNDDNNKNFCKQLSYAPLNVYFLDIEVPSSSLLSSTWSPLPMSAPKMPQQFLLFGQLPMLMDDAETLAIEQTECLLYNVFTFAPQHTIIALRVNRLRRLMKLVYGEQHYLRQQQQQQVQRRFECYNRIKADRTAVFVIRDVRNILNCVGLLLGVKLIIELYFLRRFKNRIAHVTYQINFPLHKWNKRYFSICWKHYCAILNDVFELNQTIE